MGRVTPDVVAHSSSKTAPSGYQVPLKQLAVDAARLHYDDWQSG